MESVKDCAYVDVVEDVAFHLFSIQMQEDKRKQKVQYAALCPDTMDVGMANNPFQKSQVLPEYWELFEEVAKTVKKLP